MIHYKGLLLAMLLSSTTATFWRGEGGDVGTGATLGDAFLAAANNFTTTKPLIETTTYINAQLEAEAILQVEDSFKALCTKNGYVESENSYHGDASSGQSSYANVVCRVPTSLMDMMLSAAVTMIEDADGMNYDTSTSSYVNSYNPAMFSAQKKGLENLLRLADTIEQVMLIIPSWQNIVSQISYVPNTSAVSINLNQIYTYPDYPYNSSYPPVSAPISYMTQRAGMIHHGAGED